MTVPSAPGLRSHRPSLVPGRGSNVKLEVMAMRSTPVILNVSPDPDDLAWEQEWLERLDLPVVNCGGPHKVGACPLLKGLPCGKVARADGILFQLDLDRTDHREILATYARTLDVPIRAVVSQEQQEKYADLLADIETFTPPVGPAKLDAFAAEVGA